MKFMLPRITKRQSVSSPNSSVPIEKLIPLRSSNLLYLKEKNLLSVKQTENRYRSSSFLVFIEYQAGYFSDSKYPPSNLAIFVIYALQRIDWCRTRRISRNVALPEDTSRFVIWRKHFMWKWNEKKEKKIYIYIYVSIVIFSYVAENFVKILLR